MRRERAFLRVFLATWFGGLALLLALAIYVNPWRNFGDVGITRLMNSRSTKLRYVAALPDAELPDAYVLGSSNTMAYDPADIERLLGYSAFNFGVFWGKSEDDLTILSWILEDRKATPKLLIVGADTWALAPAEDDHPVFPGLRRELLNEPALMKHHPPLGAWRIWWSRIIDAFSQGQLKEYYRLLRAARNGEDVARRPSPGLLESGIFRADGVRVTYGDAYGRVPGNIYEQVERGEFPIGEILQEKVDTGRTDELVHLRTYRFDRFLPARVAHLEHFVELAEAHGIDIVFVLNPVHPIFYEVLKEQTPHEANVALLRALLERLQAAHPNILAIVDASRIENFGGDPNGFFDEIHPSSTNTERVLEKIAEALGR